VHLGPVVQPHAELQRVAGRYVDRVAELVIRERVRWSGAWTLVWTVWWRRRARHRVRQADRLNREAVQMEWMVRAGLIGDGQLERVAQLCRPRGRCMRYGILRPRRRRIVAREVVLADDVVDPER